MTKKDTLKILTMIAAAYPRFEVDELKVEVWHDMLGDLDYSQAYIATKKCILGGTYPPSIHEVRKAALAMALPEVKTSGEAWGKVEKAVRNHGSYGEESAMKSFDLLTRRVVEAIGWKNICLSTEPGVERAHFMRIYDQLAQRQQETVMLPEALREQMAKIGQPVLKAIEGGKKR